MSKAFYQNRSRWKHKKKRARKGESHAIAEAMKECMKGINPCRTEIESETTLPSFSSDSKAKEPESNDTET